MFVKSEVRSAHRLFDSPATLFSAFLVVLILASSTSAQTPGNEGAPGNEGESEKRQQQELTIAHLMKLRKPIGEIRIDTGSDRRSDDRPADRSGVMLSGSSPLLVASTGGSWQPLSRYPVSFCHRPLYFQQPDLERCGRTYQCGSHSLGCLQNAVSGLTFLSNTIVLPYRMATERPDCLVPHQGDCRACQSTGADCEPVQKGTCGLVSEAAAIAGFTFLLL